MSLRRVLLADGDRLMLKALRFHLVLCGYSVLTAHDKTECKWILKNHSIDIIVSDISVIGDPAEFSEWVRNITSSPMHVIILTKQNCYTEMIKAVSSGIRDILQKPLHPRELTGRISKYLG